MPSDTLDDDAQGLRIWLLGGFRIAVGSRIIVEAEWRLRKVRSLIKVLALAPSYRLHREQVMELLWPEQAPQAVANSLHQTLYVVRRILATNPAQRAQYLQLQDERLTLCPATPLWVDVAAFETAAAQAASTRIWRRTRWHWICTPVISCPTTAMRSGPARAARPCALNMLACCATWLSWPKPIPTTRCPSRPCGGR